MASGVSKFFIGNNAEYAEQAIDAVPFDAKGEIDQEPLKQTKSGVRFPGDTRGMKKLDPEETSGSFTNRLMAYMSKAPQDRVAHDEVMGQEVLNLLSDAMVKDQFNPKATTLTRIGEAITTTLQAVGLKKMKFRTGEDVFRFVKNFNKSVEGDYMAQKVVARAAKEGIEVDFKKPKAEPGKAGTMMSKAERTSIKNTLADFVQEPDGTK